MPARPRPRLLALAGAAAFTASLGLAPSAAAAGPPEVTSFERTFVSPLLTEVCGVEVTQHLWGYFRTVTHGDRTITNFHFRSTLTAGDNVVDSRAFGPTMEVQNADGSTTVTQLGVTMRNIPGTGAAGPMAGRSVVTITADGEEIEGPQSGYREDHTELCAALTA